MSNRVNRALADAWLSSDKAATERQFEKEYKEGIEAYNLEVAEAQAAVAADRKSRSFWDDVGEVVGGGIGATVGFITGGPAGAAKGAAVGHKVGTTISGAIYDLDDSKFNNFDTQVSEANNFQINFSRKATKYKDQQKLGRAAEESIDLSQAENKGQFDQYKAENTRTDFEIFTDTAANLYTDYKGGVALYDNLLSSFTSFQGSDFGKYLDIDDKLADYFTGLQEDFDSGEFNPSSVFDNIGLNYQMKDVNFDGKHNLGDAGAYIANLYDDLMDMENKFIDWVNE